MATTVACRECGDSFTISPEHLGRKYRCKSCGAVNVAEVSKPPADRKKRPSSDAARRKPSQKSSQQRSAGASQKPRQPQKKRRPKPAPEPSYDEYSYEYDEAEYEAYEDYDAVEEYQPSRSRSRQSSGKKKKRSSSKSSLHSIPWKRIGSILGAIFLVLIIAGRVMRVIVKVDRAIGDVQTADESGSLTEYMSVEGGFRAMMPPPVGENHSSHSDPRFSSWRWEALKGPFSHVVVKGTAFSDLADAVQQTKDSYDVNAKHLIASIGLRGELMSERHTTLGGHEAVELEFKLADPNPGTMCTRIAVVDSYEWNVYIMRVTPGPVPSEIKNPFFDSFQFLNSDSTDSPSAQDSQELKLTVEEPPGGGFRILMPGASERRVETLPGWGDGKPVLSETWIARSGLAVSVNRIRRPTRPVDDRDFLESVVEGHASEHAGAGVVISDQIECSLGLLKATQVTMEVSNVPKPILGYKRIALDAQYVWYVLVASESSSGLAEKYSETVFSSFRLTE